MRAQDMGYVVYEVASTLLVTTKEYITRSAARAARTRYLKKIHKETGHIGTDIDYAIADSVAFYTKIEKKVPRENLMSGKTFYEGVNTPIYCSPASESYWSM
jgi:hypothetical protein